MSFYYTLEFEDGTYVFERADRLDFSTVEWYIDETYFYNPAHPTDKEIAVLDMAKGHTESLKTVWPIFQEYRFNYLLNISVGKI